MGYIHKSGKKKFDETQLACSHDQLIKNQHYLAHSLSVLRDWCFHVAGKHVSPDLPEPTFIFDLEYVHGCPFTFLLQVSHR